MLYSWLVFSVCCQQLEFWGFRDPFSSSSLCFCICISFRKLCASVVNFTGFHFISQKPHHPQISVPWAFDTMPFVKLSGVTMNFEAHPLLFWVNSTFDLSESSDFTVISLSSPLDHVFLAVLWVCSLLRSHFLILALFYIWRGWEFLKPSSPGFFLFRRLSFSLSLVSHSKQQVKNQTTLSALIGNLRYITQLVRYIFYSPKIANNGIAKFSACT